LDCQAWRQSSPGHGGEGEQVAAGGLGRIWLGGTAVYDAWWAVLRAANPSFAFTDPPFRHSLPMTLAFAATGSRPTAVLTGPRHRLGAGPGPARPDRLADTYMVCIRVDQHRLAATAGLIWNGDLPRLLQQMLFDTADSATF
jgi:hypothetical protein